VPLLEQLCVLKEVDLHYKWAPFCSSSMMIADLDKLDSVGWFMVGLTSFGIARDGCFRVIGCDNIEEDGSIVLAGHGLKDRKPTDTSPHDDTYLSDDPLVEKLDIPPVPSRRGSGRMTIKKFDAKIHVTSPTSASTRIVANINPNLALPQSLLEFIMKHLAGVVLAKLQVAAKKVAKNPVTNVHAIKMREEKEFYKDWLIVKFQHMCDQNNWEMPKVSAFHMSEQDLNKAGRKTLPRRMETYSGPEPETAPQSIDGDNSQPPGDACSELTTASARTWTSNPIGSYLREIEEKTRQRKEADIAKSRQIAADRLKPNDIPRDRQGRLDELKIAKERRLMRYNHTLTSGSDAVPAKKLSMSQRVTSSLHGHGRVTRFVIISFLVMVLFTMLHPDFLLRTSSLTFYPDGAWWKPLLEDAGVVVYMWLCSIVHFALCDVALVYAFEALEIGSKSGQQAKQYYSDNVRFGVALLSAAILGFSILKSATKVWMRAALWYLFQLFVLLKDTCWPNDSISAAYSMIPQPVLYTWDTLLSLSYSVIGYTTRAFAYVPLTRLVRSNFVGRTCLHILESSLDFVLSLSRGAMDFISTAIEGFEGKVSIFSWRTEAFATAGSLFSYTAIFLLTILVLFNLSAKKSRREKKPSRSGKHVTIADMPNLSLQTATSSLSDDNDGAPRRTRQTHATIPEHEVVFHEMGNGTVKPFSLDSSQDGASTTSTTSTRRRRMRFRFRRNKANSSIQPTATSKVSLRKSKSM
jgi:hypothetical protein